jgi:putative toxin-antitoxin system antitoxin component (TIGR02293 family)
MSQADKSSALAKLRRRGKRPTRGERSKVSASRGRVFAKTTRVSVGASKHRVTIDYRSSTGVDDYVRQIVNATPMQVVEIERAGVVGSFIKDLSKRMEIPSSRIFSILGIPKATAEKKAAAGEMVAGSGGQAAIGMVKLLGIAQQIVADSTASEAKGFDAAKWLGQWIEHPQPSLGGRKPADLLDTPTGIEVVARLLGSIESGTYQ